MSSATCTFVGIEEFWWFHIGLQLPFGPFSVERKGVSDHLFLILFLLRTVKMFISTGKIIVPFSAQRILVRQCFFFCSTEPYSTVFSKICLWDVMLRGHRAMFLEGLLVYHALAMADYKYLGCWARYSLCGTARHSCPVCTIWTTCPCDVVASIVFALFVFVLYHISCCYFPFYKVDVHLPRKLPTYEIQSLAS